MTLDGCRLESRAAELQHAELCLASPGDKLPRVAAVAEGLPVRRPLIALNPAMLSASLALSHLDRQQLTNENVTRCPPLYQIPQTIRARRIELIDKEVEDDAQIASQHSPPSHP